MLVYGDRTRFEDPRTKLAGIQESLCRSVRLPPGIERHGEIVAAFIDAGELLQGIADAEFSLYGTDARSPEIEAATAVLLDLALAVKESWKGGFRFTTCFPSPALHAIEAAALPGVVETKLGEGYAFYAVYPEGYLQAATAQPRDRPVRVIGIRSIGTGLSAMVSVAVGGPPPVTVRPVGHPFQRQLALSSELARELTGPPEARYAVVDEGPGLSGSSFGAVADFLESRGVSPDRIHFFPSHRGDLGPQAEPRHRERWSRAARHVVDFDSLVLQADEPPHRLESWFSGLLGPPLGPLEEVSGGAWREKHFPSEADWPASDVAQERRKFLYRAESGTWLLKFAGLGREGMRKAERARELHAAGFTPDVAGFRHGFLAERWLEEARPLDRRDIDRPAFIRHLGRYLGFRAARFTTDPNRGASLSALLEMGRYNTRTALGNAAAYFDRLSVDLPRLETALYPVETDNRLQPWEWLRLPDGRLLKTDAFDHHAAHDLIGCQDVAWDVAGAAVEFDLGNGEVAELRRIVDAESGRHIDPDLVRGLIPCYLAFQLGRCSLAADSLSWPAEAGRLRRAARDYVGKLERLIAF